MPLARFDTWVRSAVGPAAAGTLVYVCAQPAVTTTIPPSPLASLFSDSGSVTPVTQPLVADGFGHAYAYVASGIYTVVLVQYGLVQQVFPDQLVTSSSGAGTDLTLQTNGVPNTVQSLLNLKGTGSVSVSSDGVGGVTVTGSLPPSVLAQFVVGSGAGTITPGMAVMFDQDSGTVVYPADLGLQPNSPFAGVATTTASDGQLLTVQISGLTSVLTNNASLSNYLTALNNGAGTVTSYKTAVGSTSNNCLGNYILGIAVGAWDSSSGLQPVLVAPFMVPSIGIQVNSFNSTSVGPNSINTQQGTVGGSVEYVVLCTGGSGGITRTLPPANYTTQSDGLRVTVVKVDSGVGVITITPYSGDTINGLSSYSTQSSQYSFFTLVSDNVHTWYVVSQTPIPVVAVPPSGQNVWPTSYAGLVASNPAPVVIGGNTWTQMLPGPLAYCNPSTWKFRLVASSGTNIVVRASLAVCAAGSLTVSYFTPITFNGGSVGANFTTFVDSDPIVVQIDSDHDYYIAVYYDPTSGNAEYWQGSSLNLGAGSYAVNQSGDQTATNPITSSSGSNGNLFKKIVVV